MISALMPFLIKSPPTSATHNTPWVGETAENATLTLSAAKLGRAKTITSRTLNPRTGNFLMPYRDRGQNIMDPGKLLCVRRSFRKPSTAAFRRTIVESMNSVKHNQNGRLRPGRSGKVRGDGVERSSQLQTKRCVWQVMAQPPSRGKKGASLELLSYNLLT